MIPFSLVTLLSQGLYKENCAYIGCLNDNFVCCNLTDNCIKSRVCSVHTKVKSVSPPAEASS